MRNMGTRVKVWSGDQKTYLGEGTLIGFVTVYFLVENDGSLKSGANAEEKPVGYPEDRIVEATGNPKIRLDNGEFVYGCQVWWEPIKKISG